MRHLSIPERLGMAEARAVRMESRIAQQDKIIALQRAQIDAIVAFLKGMPTTSDARLPQPAYKRRMAEIAAEVAIANDLTVAELKSEDRTFRITHPRQDAMLQMHKAGFSLPMIGRFFSRDHTTVLYGCRAAKARATEGVNG